MNLQEMVGKLNQIHRELSIKVDVNYVSYPGNTAMIRLESADTKMYTRIWNEAMIFYAYSLLVQTDSFQDYVAKVSTIQEIIHEKGEGYEGITDTLLPDFTLESHMKRMIQTIDEICDMIGSDDDEFDRVIKLYQEEISGD